MAYCEDLDDSEIEPVPVTPPSCDRPECSRISIRSELVVQRAPLCKRPRLAGPNHLLGTIQITLIAYYASICCYARRCLLCLKLCQHNSPMPMYELLKFPGVVSFLHCVTLLASCTTVVTVQQPVQTCTNVLHAFRRGV